MQYEHRVFGIPPGKHKSIFCASFTLSRWQWAEKFAAYLEHKGFRSVKVRTSELKPAGR